MLLISEHQRYFVHTGATDMRKGFDTLSGLVRSEMKPLNSQNRKLYLQPVKKGSHLLMGISKFISGVKDDFEVYGELDDGWEEFRPGIDYNGFLVRRKIS